MTHEQFVELTEKFKIVHDAFFEYQEKVNKSILHEEAQYLPTAQETETFLNVVQEFKDFWVTEEK